MAKPKGAGGAPPELEETRVNDSELVALCRMNDIPGASRAWTRETCIRALKKLEDPQQPNPLDPSRKKLSAFLRRHWGKTAMQLESERCPNCQDSCDLQVAKCYLENYHQLT